jgi:primosomal replication protein N
MNESISNDSHSTGIGVKAIDLILQARSWTEVLDIAIDCVCEIDIFVLWVDGYIVQRVELTTEVVIKED